MASPSNPKTILSTFNLIYLSILSVMVLFAVVAFYLNYSGQNSPNDDVATIQVYRYILIALMVGGVVAGYFIYKQKLAAIDPTQTLVQRLGQLQAAILIRSACLEVPGLFGAVLAMISGDNSSLLFTVLIVIIFTFWRPSPARIAEDLQFTEAERSEVL